MQPIQPLVSVVIPTKNRPHLVTRAVRSALSQTLNEIEVIVVIDGPDEAILKVLSQIDDPRLRVKTLPQNVGCGLARNAGVEEARGQWIAFLDDDDEWFPKKLELQLQTAQQSQYHYPIISCFLIGRTEVGDFIWPRRIPHPTEALSDYLFCRRTLLWGEGVLHPSTFFTARELVKKVSFRSDLRTHEDFDWLLRAITLEGVGVEFVHKPDPLVICHIEENRGRMSNLTDWHDSIDWIQANRHLVTPRAYASFILTWVSTFAARRRDWKAILPLLREAFRSGKPTIMDILVFWGNWLLPQKVQRRIASFGVKNRRWFR